MPPKRKTEPVVFEDFIFNTPLPNDTELEEVVLGALMLDKHAYGKVNQYLKSANVFYLEKHQQIFRAVISCIEKYNEVDIVLVTDELRRMNAIGESLSAYDVAMMTSKVVNSDHVLSHSLILFEKYIAREILRSGAMIVKRAYQNSDDVFLTLDESLKILDDTRMEIASMKNIDFQKQISDTMIAIEKASNGAPLGHSTGMPNIDAITGGRVRGELTLIAARPSIGKTARMIQEAMNMALGQDLKVGIISMEMTHRQIIERMLSNMSRINSQFIREGRLSPNDWTNLVHSSDRLADTNFFLNDISNLTVSDIRGIVRNWKKNEGIDIVFVDYIGLIKFQNVNGKPVDEIGKISRGLKTIAGECDIPVVALAQLNREVEKRGDKRPMMSDLRDSGSLEQDADVVSFLYRPDYYGVLQDDNGESTEGLCEENIAKNRNGMIGRTWHRYAKEIGEFTHHKEVPIEVSIVPKGIEEQKQKVTVEDLPW